MSQRCILLSMALMAVAAAPAAADDPPPPAKVPPLAGQVEAACERIVADAIQSRDFAAGALAARDLLLRVLAWEKLTDADAIGRAVHTLRLMDQLNQVSGGLGDAATGELAGWLVKQKALARMLPLALTPQDRPAEVYRVLNQLRKLSAKAVAEYPDLATAICVVFDRPMQRQINENGREAPETADVFKFFAGHDSHMLWGRKKVPWELQVWTVDVTSPVKELEWALKKFKGDKSVGKLFFKIEYDTAAYRGAPKKVTRAGYNLPNILKYGGVCADQAYFATEVGKAIGCPTAYTVGRGLHGGHAWVGFLQGRGGKAVWNFTVGRYKTHKYYRGTVLDPQTRQRIPDSVVELLADTLDAGGGGRRAAGAYIEAARIALGRPGDIAAGERLPMPATGHEIDHRGRRETPREGGIELALSLVKGSVAQCPANRYSWTFVRDLAAKGDLTTAHMKEWSDALIKEVGKKYPDFTFDVLMPMVESIEEAKDRSGVLEKMFKFFRKRPDLASDILLAHGRLWEAEGEPKKALALYKDSISKFLTDGPMVLKSLDHIEKLLAGRGEKTYLAILEKTFRALKKPGEFYNLQDSMWYKVGIRYATALRTAGKDKQARKVEDYVKRGGGRS